MLAVPTVLVMDTVPARALDNTLPLMLELSTPLTLELIIALAIVLAIVLALPDATPAGLELAPEGQPAAVGRLFTPAVAQSWSAKVMVAAKVGCQRLSTP